MLEPPGTGGYETPSESNERHEDVDARLRFREGHLCWACGGHKDLPQRQGIRCFGYESSYVDGFYCTREEYAGKLKSVTETLGHAAYLHMFGACGCGKSHGYQPDGTLPVEMSLDERMRRVLEALAAANNPKNYRPHIFVRGGVLVRVHTDEDVRPSIKALQHAGLQGEIAAVARFTKKLKSEPFPVNLSHPDDALVSMILQAPRYVGMPALAGITEVPVLRADGSVLDLPGYDAATRLLYRPTMGSKPIATVADTPTAEDVARALALIWEAIGQFPYETLADQANALGLLLTPVMRAAINGQVPLLAVEAPEKGTGKSLLTDVMLTTTVGANRGKMTEAESEAEWRKKITTALRSGHPVNVVDNLSRPLESAQLSSALTSPVWADRILSRNEDVQLPSRAVWVVSGNNIAIGGDLPRRTVRIRLNAKMVHPWTRSGFKHPDLLTWVEAHRAELVHALLTLARASMLPGVLIPKLPTMGGFEQWVKVVGRAVALDPKVGTHFLGNVEELWETEDSEAVEWEEFLSKWYEHFHDKPVTRRSFISRCVSPSAWGFSNSASMMHSTKRYQRTLLKR